MVLADTVVEKPIMYLKLNPFAIPNRVPGYCCVRNGEQVVAVKYCATGEYRCPVCNVTVKMRTIVDHYDCTHPNISHRYMAQELDWMQHYKLREV